MFSRIYEYSSLTYNQWYHHLLSKIIKVLFFYDKKRIIISSIIFGLCLQLTWAMLAAQYSCIYNNKIGSNQITFWINTDFLIWKGISSNKNLRQSPFELIQTYFIWKEICSNKNLRQPFKAQTCINS